MRVCAVAPFLPDQVTASDDSRWHAHDILRLHRLQAFDDEPAWVRDAFARAPFVVVRRAQAAPGFVAVGVRGFARHERYGTWARCEDIEAAVKPEALPSASTLSAERRSLPALAALAALETLRGDSSSRLDALAWGPTGSVGFELATSIPIVSSTSDLDLLIRIPNRFSLAEAQKLQALFDMHASRAGVRIDVQLETPAGGIALAEYASGKARVMARHASGPRLVADPWAIVHEHHEQTGI